MPSLIAHHALQVVAILMVLAGLVGLAPTVLAFVRAHRGGAGSSGAARCDQGSEQGDGLLFPGKLAGIPSPGDGPSGGLLHDGRGPGSVPALAPLATSSATASVGETTSAATSESVAPAAVEGLLIPATGDVKGDEADEGGETEDSDEDIPPDTGPEPVTQSDGLMAQFEYKVTVSVVPEALSQAYEEVSIEDLVAEARSLRSLIGSIPI